ncbi:MAG: nuclear transport factor 2 family protein [Sphingobium sp.]|nr:nuclear transport factor 2 family protein [Sphingobium sp.]
MSKIRRSVIAAAATLMLAGGMTMSAEASQPKYGANYGNDRAQIEDLMARYLFAIDYFDWDAYVATFAPDGELTFASGTSKGREAIRAAVTKFAEGIGRVYHTADGKPAKLRHIILQTSIRVEGNHAWARSVWLEMANHGPNDEPKIGTYGLYEDEMVKINGQWLFSKRNVLNEFLKGRNSGPGNPVGDMDKLAAALLAGKK